MVRQGELQRLVSVAKQTELTFDLVRHLHAFRCGFECVSMQAPWAAANPAHSTRIAVFVV